MDELKTFENAELGAVRTLLIDGEPYFVGKDVAEILGYSNSRKALADHVDDEDKNDGVTYVKTFSDCPYTEPSKVLKYGDTGAAWLQWHLKKCGAKVSIDGKFGPNTKAALMAFQKAHGLATDGVAGAKTRQALKLEVI